MTWTCPTCSNSVNSDDEIRCACGFEHTEKEIEKAEVPLISSYPVSKLNNLSKSGLTIAVLYFVIFVVVYSYLQYSARTNPGDSGEGGIYLVPFVLPWYLLVPDSHFRESFATPLHCISALLNSIIIYLLCGGVTTFWRSRK